MALFGYLYQIDNLIERYRPAAGLLLPQPRRGGDQGRRAGGPDGRSAPASTWSSPAAVARGEAEDGCRPRRDRGAQRLPHPALGRRARLRLPARRGHPARRPAGSRRGREARLQRPGSRGRLADLRAPRAASGGPQPHRPPLPRLSGRGCLPRRGPEYFFGAGGAVLKEALITPALFSHRTPVPREKRERLCSALQAPLLPAGVAVRMGE